MFGAVTAQMGGYYLDDIHCLQMKNSYRSHNFSEMSIYDFNTIKIGPNFHRLRH